MKEEIICASIWFPDFEMNHPCQVGGLLMSVAQFNALPKSILPLHKYVQGFLTNKNRFLDRKEAHKLFAEPELYSEDLY